PRRSGDAAPCRAKATSCATRFSRWLRCIQQVCGPRRSCCQIRRPLDLAAAQLPAIHQLGMDVHRDSTELPPELHRARWSPIETAPPSSIAPRTSGILSRQLGALVLLLPNAYAPGTQRMLGKTARAARQSSPDQVTAGYWQP